MTGSVVLTAYIWVPASEAEVVSLNLVHFCQIPTN